MRERGESGTDMSVILSELEIWSLSSPLERDGDQILLLEYMRQLEQNRI